MIDEQRLRKMAESWGPNRDGLSEEQLAQGVIDLLEERKRLRNALEEIAEGDGRCNSKYGPGCDGHCQQWARKAL